MLEYSINMTMLGSRNIFGTWFLSNTHCERRKMILTYWEPYVCLFVCVSINHIFFYKKINSIYLVIKINNLIFYVWIFQLHENICLDMLTYCDTRNDSESKHLCNIIKYHYEKSIWRNLTTCSCFAIHPF